MYTIKKETWNNYHNISHEQKYFIHKWGDLLNYRTIELNRVPLIGLRGMLKDLIEIFDLCKSNKLHESNLHYTAKEIKSKITDNMIIKKYYDIDYITIIDILEKISNGNHTGEPHVKEILSSFSKKLNKYYYNNIVDFLNEKLGEGKYTYHNIDKLTIFLLNDLLYQGYSTNYLFNWGLKVFVFDDEPQFHNRLNKLKELGENKERKFKCLFILKLPKKISSIKTGDQINFYNNKNNINLKTEFLDKIPDLETDSQYYTTITTKAMDKNSALNNSDLKLNNLIKLHQISNPKYEPNIRKEVKIFSKNSDWTEKINYKRFLNIKIEDNLSSFIENYMGTQNEKCNQQTLHTLNKALHWCRIANDSPLESKFLSFWTTLEFLLTTHTSKIIQPITSFLPPIIGIDYMRKIVLEIGERIRKSRAEIDNHKIENKLKQLITQQGKIILPTLFEDIIENEEIWVSAFQNDFIKRKIRWLSNSLNDNNMFAKKIKNIVKQVEYDLRRLYRLRNLLAHQAHVGESRLNNYTRRLKHYLEIVLNKILYSFDNNKKHNHLELLICKQKSYEILINKIKNNNYPNIKPRQIIYPETSLSN